MPKTPAILWYFDNWHGGTIGFNRHLKGCYMDLLNAQFQLGHLSLEQVRNILGIDFNQWEFLKVKFIKDDGGKYFNGRLEAEIEKARSKSQKQSENVKKRWDKYNGNTTVYTTVLPKNIPKYIEIENEIERDIGGMGEKGRTSEKTDLTDLEISNTIEFIDRVVQRKLNKSEVLNFWQAFKIHAPQGKFENENDYVRHFRDWLKFRAADKKQAVTEKKETPFVNLMDLPG